MEELSFNQALDRLVKLYQVMRVELLEEDELEQELKCRDVILSGLDLSRKRKCLRDALKREKESGSKLGSLHLRSDPENEREICLVKFKQLKKTLQSNTSDDMQKRISLARLAHVGARVATLLCSSRGSPNLLTQMQNVLVELVQLMQTAIEPPGSEQQDTTIDNPSQAMVEATGSARSEVPTPTALGQDDLDWIHSLQARIVGLEEELAKRKEGKDAETQTNQEIQNVSNPLDGGTNMNFENFSANSSFQNNSFPRILSNPTHPQDPYPNPYNQFPAPLNFPNQTLPNVNVSQNVGQPNPPAQNFPMQNPSQPPFANRWLPNQYQGQPGFPYGPSGGQYGQPGLSYPFQTPVQSRHTLPVSKWNIAKYSGDDQGLKLNEFLEVVHALSMAERVSEQELFESAVHLFTGSALKWYMTQRSMGRLISWQHLVFELRRTYLHPDLDALIKMKVYQRRQRQQESFYEFYSEVEKLIRTMSAPIPEFEKIQILQQNMRMDYKKQMAFVPVLNLESLVAAGQKLDALNFSAYNKVFGPDKVVNVIEGSDHKQATKNRQQVATSDTSAAVQQLQNSYPRAAVAGSKGNSAPKSQNQFSPNLPGPSRQLVGKSSGETSSSQSQPPLTLEMVVNNHKPPPSNRCYNCNREGHHAAICRQPPIIVCFKCGLRGFPTAMCPYCVKNHGTANQNRGSQERQADTEICNISYPFPNDHRPFVEIRIHDFPVRALLDSGSNYSLISENLFAKTRQKKVFALAKSLDLHSASGDSLEVLGQACLPIQFDGRIKVITILVVANLSIDCICGMDFWTKFHIVPTQLTGDSVNAAVVEEVPDPTNMSSLEEEEKLEEIKNSFLAAGHGKLTTTPLATHRIVLKEEYKGKPPVRQFPYVMSPKTQALVAVELERLLEAGIIERSDSDWSLNCVPVIKPNKVRLCLDARKINERTVRDAYPLPHPGRILGQLPKANYLSTIDLSEAFLQVPLDKESRRYTAFSVQGKGLFQYTRMCFGLVNSPASLAKIMDFVLGHGILEPNVFVYLDDIVVVTETFEHHVQLLTEISRRLREANLSINRDKSRFGVSEVPFLGYLLGTEGLRTNPEKVRPILEYERPTTVTKLRRFLGMANYYRRFIPDFSGTTAALTDLLQTKSKLVRWNEDAETAFVRIKELLISSPILASPDFSRPFTIQTDASDVAVAGVLTQQHEDGECVIAYYSHKLSTPQKNYHAAEKEALAAILAIDAFRGYIEGYHFTLITDSSALTHILNAKWKVGSRCSRWALILQQYDMRIVHRKGKENVVPDALSRSIAAIDSPSTTWYDSMLHKVVSRPDDYVDFRVENGQLLKYISVPDYPHDANFAWKRVPRTEDIAKIIEDSHNSSFHSGYERTLARIRQRYYWPRMTVEIRNFVRHCTTCKEVKPSHVAMVPEMGKMRLADRPWQMISVDFIGPLPRSRKGNQHLLVVSDYFSKWVLVQPVKKIASSTLCVILKDQWFMKNSVPEIIITDNGSSFLSKEFKSLLDQFKITHWLNSRYHSQANPVERVNRTINAAIRTYVKGDQRLWDTKIAEIEMILNTSVHSPTGFTPYFIIHGHEYAEQGNDYRLARHGENLTPEQFEKRRKDLYLSVYELVKKNLEKAYTSSKRVYDLRIRPAKPFTIGQLVYRRNMKLSNAGESYNSKYGPQYLPCKIKSVKGTSSYTLEDLQGKDLGVWPAAHIKPA
ncbi:uncharacterized protein LOC129748419 [Uranotaenia lowii]|uniref:uncharacterized protein LOC129748419 n=1 Tax=Uranotaenia lowii TaxID=190385 RepID=UPI002479FBB9|nr:uncharacterized protein LOC129748419 [Uranotaenia lowii]